MKRPLVTGFCGVGNCHRCPGVLRNGDRSWTCTHPCHRPQPPTPSCPTCGQALPEESK